MIREPALTLADYRESYLYQIWRQKICKCSLEDEFCKAKRCSCLEIIIIGTNRVQHRMVVKIMRNFKDVGQ